MAVSLIFLARVCKLVTITGCASSDFDIHHLRCSHPSDRSTPQLGFHRLPLSHPGLFTKRLGQGGFIWPQVNDRGGKIVLSSTHLSLLIEGIDWRVPERVWRPMVAG